MPESTDTEQRARLLAHVQGSDRCRVRVEHVRAELHEALDGTASADRAVDLAAELDQLERTQQRMDGWLVALVEQLSTTPRAVRYDDGVPA